MYCATRWLWRAFLCAAVLLPVTYACSVRSKLTDPVTVDIHNDTLNLKNEVIIPDYQPLDLPYSEWEGARHRELLAANEIGDDTASLLTGLKHSSGLIREASLYLLSESPDSSDIQWYESACNDRDQSVRSLAAYACVRLGDTSKIGILREIAGLDPESNVASLKACGLLARLNDEQGLPVIENALRSDLEYVRLLAIHQAWLFIPSNDRSSENIDSKVLDLYREILKHPDSRVRLIARMQLEETTNQEFKALIKD